MKITRSKFAQHLTRLACNKQVTEVVFCNGFAADALTPDQLLLVSVPDLAGAEPLEGEIGVADLELLSRAARMLQGEGNTGVEVDVYVEGGRLVIDDGPRGVQRLVLAAPKTIATRIEAATVAKLFDAVPDGLSVDLARSTLEGVRDAFTLYKAEEVELQVGPAGVKIIVGTERSHRAEFPVSDTASMQSFSLLFGKHLVDVFGIVTDFSSAKMRVGGPGKAILIEDGEYCYMLSPRSRSADETKPAVKGSKKKAAAEPEAEESPEAKPAGGAKSRASKRAAKRASTTEE